MERDNRQLRNQGPQGHINIPPGMSKGRPPMAPRETSQHTELIKYIHDSWHKITLDQVNSVVYYKSEPLDNFKPFDLESLLSKRIMENYPRGHQ